MRSIHVVTLDKLRPVLVLTRGVALPYLIRVTVAPITSTVRGIAVEVALGIVNGLDHHCVANLDGVTTIPAASLGAQVGFLLDSQEADLVAAIHAAYDLD